MIQDKNTAFWNYLSQPQKDLIIQGEYLMNEVVIDEKYNFKDYSFLIFPYAKALEGFLKQLFKDVDFISRLDYISDHLRLGKLMSPNLVGRLGDRSIYKKLKETTTDDMAAKLWETWKLGRNQIFHYFPHNIKAVNFEEAQGIIKNILDTMEEVYESLKLKIKTPVHN